MKVAIVTGISSGIGRSTAVALAQAGFKVFGRSARPTPRCRRVSSAWCWTCGMNRRRRAVAEVQQTAGRIDVLVNNAGGALSGAIEETRTEQAQALFDVNFFGAVRVTRAVLPVMRAQGSGRIASCEQRRRLPAGALHGLLRGVEARARGLQRVPGSRGARLRRARGAHRAGLHEDEHRSERRGGVSAARRRMPPRANACRPTSTARSRRAMIRCWWRRRSSRPRPRRSRSCATRSARAPARWRRCAA